MLWYTISLISVLTNVMEYVHLTSHHLRQRKPLVLVTLISAIGTGGLDFLIAYAMLILRHAFRDNCYLTLEAR